MSVTFSGADSRRPHSRWPDAWATVPDPADPAEMHPFNLNNVNARALLVVLELEGANDPTLTGRAALQTVREAGKVAASRLRLGDPLESLGPLRRDQRDYLIQRVETLLELVDRLGAAGATHVTWG